jgi:DNA-binding transcriptional MerR regulator
MRLAAARKSADLRLLSSEIPEAEGIGNRLYTVSQLTRLSGMTRKQAVYWAHVNLLTPALQVPEARGKNPAYFYSSEEVLRALIFCELKRSGFSLQQIKEVARNLEKDGVRLENAETYLLTDGYSVYYADSDHEVVDILRHHRQLLLLIPVREQVRKLTEAA